jgi:hypothetical protein
MKLLGANYIWRKIPLHKKVIKQLKEFLNIFQEKDSFYQKHYNVFKIIFIVLEIAFVIFAFYFIYNLITPKTDIYIQPAVRVKHLVQKYYLYPENKKDKFNFEESLNRIPYKNIVF